MFMRRITMFNIFKNKKKQLLIKFPLVGKAIDIAEVPDEVFASKMVGDGVAFEPYEGTAYSPVDGKVVQLFPSKHAVGIRTPEGIEILIHVGIDTVHMNGEGFEYLVKEDQDVKAGDRLMNFNLELIKQKAKSILIPMLITNMDAVKNLECIYGDGNLSMDSMVVEVK